MSNFSADNKYFTLMLKYYNLRLYLEINRILAPNFKVTETAGLSS
jgi:hypothetical protein